MFKWLFGSKDGPVAEAEGTKELLVVHRHVAADPDRAFHLFVDEFRRWWPRDETLAKDKLADTRIEPKIGGRCYETDTSGATTTWGTVLSFHRPDHLVIAWQLSPTGQPVDSQAAASRLDVRFVAVDANTTDVVVVHRDFPRHGDGWEGYKVRMAAKTGWPRFIELYAKAVAGA